MYAGDPARLSVRAATAKVYALEREHGSLIKGALKKALKARKAEVQTTPVGHMFSFDRGLGQMMDALATAMGDALHLSTPVQGLQHTHEGWLAHTPQGSFAATNVVLAVPTEACAALLEPFLGVRVQPLREIAYPPVMSVALGFRREDVAHALDGFGVLIPSRERVTTLGALFSSTLFPGRAPEGQVLLTVFIGGRRHEDVGEWSDEAVVSRVLADLAPILGLRALPLMSHVQRWSRAIPQYELGHLECMDNLDQAMQKLEGLTIRANWRDGVSLSDAIRNGMRVALTLHEFSVQLSKVD